MHFGGALRCATPWRIWASSGRNASEGGSYVLHLPDANNRFYLMPILDGWTEVVGDPRTRTTGDKAGDYAITGPQWTGVLPAGVKQIKSDTNML
jgi:hypothetical protein